MCLTLVHQESRGDRSGKLAERIATATYDACRSKKVNIDSFPDVSPLVEEMQRLSGNDIAPSSGPTLNVTTQQPGGSLVVKESFFDQFGNMDEFQQVVEEHNKKYNPENVRMRERVATPRAEPSLPKKAVLISSGEPMTVEKLIALPNTFQP